MHITIAAPLVDRNDDDIEALYGCECDIDHPCTVAECQMNRDLEWHITLRRPCDDPYLAAALASGATIKSAF